MTGVKTMSRPVDTSAAQYTKGGHLLCHDDNLSGRVIAFIIYLVPPEWGPEVSRKPMLHPFSTATAARV